MALDKQATYSLEQSQIGSLARSKSLHHVSGVKICIWASAMIVAAILVALIGYILVSGIPYLTPSLFEWTYTTENVSMMPAIINTVIVVILSLLFSLPLGIGAAIYLNEYASPSSKWVKVVDVACQTLSGVPSIVFGLFGMLFFVQFLHLGLSVVSGSLTLAMMVLPSIMTTTKEALMALPVGWREGSYGLGAGHLRTIFKILLPAAAPGILSGIILATGRVLSETAALIYTAGTLSQPAFNLLSPGSTLAVHMYKLMNEGLYMQQASAVAVVLVVLCGLMNLASTWAMKKMMVKEG